jgi:hypothetical protein
MYEGSEHTRVTGGLVCHLEPPFMGWGMDSLTSVTDTDGSTLMKERNNKKNRPNDPAKMATSTQVML